MRCQLKDLDIVGQAAGLHADLPAIESWGIDLQTIFSRGSLSRLFRSSLQPFDLAGFAERRLRLRRRRSVGEDKDLRERRVRRLVRIEARVVLGNLPGSHCRKHT
jgi:hypothetical protein